MSLVREHSEKIKPPRALWCGFELGRPFGAPNEPDFQRRVLAEALALLERPEGPILDDFPDGPPGGFTGADDEDNEGWTCPVNFGGGEDPDLEKDPAGAVRREMALLRSWYGLALENNGKTMVGVSGIGIEQCVDYLSAFALDPDTPPFRTDIPRYNFFKLCVDDIKAYYFEAATARPGPATDKEVADWYYGRSAMGEFLLKLNDICSRLDDPVLRKMSDRRLIPVHQHHLKA